MRGRIVFGKLHTISKALWELTTGIGQDRR